jgi:hypothetical protein
MTNEIMIDTPDCIGFILFRFSCHSVRKFSLLWQKAGNCKLALLPTNGRLGGCLYTNYILAS